MAISSKQGYVAVPDNNVTYPAIAVLSNGEGVMAMTLRGQRATIQAQPTHSWMSTAPALSMWLPEARGLTTASPATRHRLPDPPRPRWGDYGAAVTDGSSIWIASEYIAQTCTLAQYASDPFGSCGGTRTALANWATRVSKVTP